MLSKSGAEGGVVIVREMLPVTMVSSMNKIKNHSLEMYISVHCTVQNDVF